MRRHRCAPAILPNHEARRYRSITFSPTRKVLPIEQNEFKILIHGKPLVLLKRYLPIMEFQIIDVNYFFSLSPIRSSIAASPAPFLDLIQNPRRPEFLTQRLKIGGSVIDVVSMTRFTISARSFNSRSREPCFRACNLRAIRY